MSEFCECACCGKNLEKFIQPVIYSILSKESCNGYQIIKRMKEYATFLDASPDPTGIYRYLKNMEKKQLITIDGDGNYAITDDGRACFEQWKVTLERYTRSLTQLIIEL